MDIMSMRERIARSLAVLQYTSEQLDQPSQVYGDAGHPEDGETRVWEQFLPAADAVLLALHDPTPVMLNAVVVRQADDSARELFRIAWEAMVSAAERDLT